MQDLGRRGALPVAVGPGAAYVLRATLGWDLMTTFNDRENAFENRFAHDAEQEFKIMARRNRLLGLWAAGLMGLGNDDAEAYAKAVVQADFEEAGDDDVMRKLLSDLSRAGVVTSEGDVRAEMNRLLDIARKQVLDAA